MNNSALTSIPSSGIFGWRKLVCILLVLTASSAAFASPAFSSIVVFGDSVSDTGRLFHLTHGKFPPRPAYFEGRQSNGPVWVEYLAERLDLSHRLKDYAVAGAMTGPLLPTIPTGNVWSKTYPDLDGTSLKGQLASYLADNCGRVDRDALYIVQGGANDLIDPLSALLFNPPASTDAFMQAVADLAKPAVTNIAKIVGTLKSMGARHIAVVNVPDFGKAPRLVAFGAAASGTVTMVVQFVNEAIGAQLDGIDADGQSKIARIDMFGVVDAIVADPAHYGFTNVTEQFMTLDMTSHKVTYAAPTHQAFHWLFWDDLHPTTRGHDFLAQNALTTLRAAFPAIHFESCEGAGHH